MANIGVGNVVLLYEDTSTLTEINRTTGAIVQDFEIEPHTTCPLANYTGGGILFVSSNYVALSVRQLLPDGTDGGDIVPFEALQEWITDVPPFDGDVSWAFDSVIGLRSDATNNVYIMLYVLGATSYIYVARFLANGDYNRQWRFEMPNGDGLATGYRPIVATTNVTEWITNAGISCPEDDPFIDTGTGLLINDYGAFYHGDIDPIEQFAYMQTNQYIFKCDLSQIPVEGIAVEIADFGGFIDVFDDNSANRIGLEGPPGGIRCLNDGSLLVVVHECTSHSFEKFKSISVDEYRDDPVVLATDEEYVFSYNYSSVTVELGYPDYLPAPGGQAPAATGGWWGAGARAFGSCSGNGTLSFTIVGGPTVINKINVPYTNGTQLSSITSFIFTGFMTNGASAVSEVKLTNHGPGTITVGRLGTFEQGHPTCPAELVNMYEMGDGWIDNGGIKEFSTFRTLVRRLGATGGIIGSDIELVEGSFPVATSSFWEYDAQKPRWQQMSQLGAFGNQPITILNDPLANDEDGSAELWTADSQIAELLPYWGSDRIPLVVYGGDTVNVFPGVARHAASGTARVWYSRMGA